MAEIQIIKIKSYYGDLKGLLNEIPEVGKAYFIKTFIITSFNQILDDLSSVSGTDYSAYKIPESQLDTGGRGCDITLARTQVSRIVTRLTQEFGFGQNVTENSSPSIVIFNKNQSEISLQINYTLNDLIARTEDAEGKRKLDELKNELEKPSKNWDVIKPILIWILNFSKDLFLKVLPILLQTKP